MYPRIVCTRLHFHDLGMRLLNYRHNNIIFLQILWHTRTYAQGKLKYNEHVTGSLQGRQRGQGSGEGLREQGM